MLIAFRCVSTISLIFEILYISRLKDASMSLCSLLFFIVFIHLHPILKVHVRVLGKSTGMSPPGFFTGWCQNWVLIHSIQRYCLRRDPSIEWGCNSQWRVERRISRLTWRWEALLGGSDSFQLAMSCFTLFQVQGSEKNIRHGNGSSFSHAKAFPQMEQSLWCLWPFEPWSDMSWERLNCVLGVTWRPHRWCRRTWCFIGTGLNCRSVVKKVQQLLLAPQDRDCSLKRNDSIKCHLVWISSAACPCLGSCRRTFEGETRFVPLCRTACSLVRPSLDILRQWLFQEIKLPEMLRKTSEWLKGHVLQSASYGPLTKSK